MVYPARRPLEIPPEPFPKRFIFFFFFSLRKSVRENFGGSMAGGYDYITAATMGICECLG